MQEKLDQKVENAKKLKDYLFKKSPNMLKGFQKRFFMIVQNGKQMAYFKNEEVTSKPKGAIMLAEITKIEKIKKKEFEIYYSGRKFHIKTDTEDQRNIWCDGLEVLRNYNISVREQEDIDKADKKAGQKKGWHKIGQETFKAIQEDKEKTVAQDTQITSDIENKQIMVKKGIFNYISEIKPDEILNRRMIMGYLLKRSKGKVKYFQRRWFILISAKPLYDGEKDEEILDENKLPPWMELDTVYYFKIDDKKEEGDEQGKIKLKECLEVKEKDMTKSKEKGYSFKINMGDRLFHIMAEMEMERRKWMEALRNSMRTSKEMVTKGNIKIKKNIDNIVNIYDSAQSNQEKSKNIRAKMDSDIEKCRERVIQGKKPDNIDDLFKLLDPMKTDLIDIMNACMAKEPKRTDIIKEYIEYFHEKICKELTDFWDDCHDTMGNLNFLRLSTWLSKYSEDLKNYFNDERIHGGIKILLNSYFSRGIEMTEKMVEGIIEFEKKNESAPNEDGLLFSSTPFDLFKLINEGYDLAFKVCRVKEVGPKLANYGKKIVGFFQNLLEETLDEEYLDDKKLITICNNTTSFNSLTKQYQTRLVSELGMKDEEVEKIFDPSSLLKQFGALGENAKDRLFTSLFQDMSKFFKVAYLKFDIETVINQVVENSKALIELLHDSFARKIWKSFLTKLVMLYFQCFIISCNKASKDEKDDFVEKLEADKAMLEENFNGLLFDSVITTCLKPFGEMIEFVNERSVLQISNNCKNLRMAFGPAFTIKTIKVILNLRESSGKTEKADILEACKETIELYNKENGEDEKRDLDKGKMFDMFSEMNIEKEMEDDGEEKKTEAEDDPRRKKSIHLDDLELPEEEVKEVAKPQIKQEEDKFNGEGFLLKKPPKKIRKYWEKRYVRIKNGVLYWYINERSREAQNKISLIEVEDCFQVQNKPNKFKIQIMTGKGKKKTYKFQAENPQEVMTWIKYIRNQLKSLKEVDNFENIVTTVEGKNPLFKDYDEINRQKKFLEQRKKREEKEKAKKQAKIDASRAAEGKTLTKAPTKRLDIDMSNPMLFSQTTVRAGTANFPRNPTVHNPNVVEVDAPATSGSGKGCCYKLMDMLGLAPRPKDEYYGMK